MNSLLKVLADSSFDPSGLIIGVVFGIVGLMAIIVIICHIKIVKQTDEFVIERLGKYTTTWGVGIHLSLKELLQEFQ